MIYYLFKEIQQLKKNTPQDITHVFEKYLQEIRSENDRLKTEISPTIDEPEYKQEHQHFIKEEQEIEGTTSFMPEISKTKDVTETSIQAQILQMYHQGISPEVIAKRLNCGNTEVALSIKLYKKKNP